MPKFATKNLSPMQRAPIVASTPARTHEGGLGAVRDPKGELFMLAVANLVSEDTHYEKGKARDTRYAQLVRAVTVEDPEWVAALVPYLRKDLWLRSVSIVTAAEYVAAGGPNGRGVVSAACQRADEPAEMFAYWVGMYGRKLPKPIKRGIADAAARLYTERSALRNDGIDNVVRMGDIIELTHPKPKAPWQSLLFKHLVDKRHGHAEGVPGELGVLTADMVLRALPEERRRSVVQAVAAGASFVRFADDEPLVPSLQAAGWSWERLAGWLPGGMDAEAWEAVIPNMGYMALLRNLRNFDKAGLSDEAVKPVLDKLTDLTEIARSKQMPFRFYSAYREVQSLRWAYALQQALEASLGNVPKLDGRTLILLDLSPSMVNRISAKSERMRWEIGAIFAVALAQRADYADLIGYSGSSANMRYDAPLLRMVDGIRQLVEHGNGTYTGTALQTHYNGHDRVIIVTDGEAHDKVGAAMDSCRKMSGQPPTFYTFNIGGYRPTHAMTGKGRYEFGSLNDAAFTLLAVLDAGRDGEWPHLAKADA